MGVAAEGCGEAGGAGPVAAAGEQQRRRRGLAGMPSIPGVPGTSGPDSSERDPALLHPRRPVNQHPPLSHRPRQHGGPCRHRRLKGENLAGNTAAPTVTGKGPGGTSTR